MRIGIFGGSFNPVHKGHIKVANEAISKLKLDHLFLVPTYRNPFRLEEKNVAGKHRMAMLELVKTSKMIVDDWEIAQKKTSYTIDLVNNYRERYPNDEIFLLIGSDLVPTLDRWKDIAEIASAVRIVVFRRDENFDHPNTRRFNCLVLNNDVYEFASSWFRAGKIQNVETKVVQYISKHFLYIESILSSMMDEDRYAHSLSAANIAKQIAQSIGYSPENAFFAGLAHDVTKIWTNDQHREFLRAHSIDDSQVPNYELHSLTGAVWLEKVYLLTNAEILSAVRKHTTLSEDLAPLDKIVFAADKLDDYIKTDFGQELLTLILQDFEAGFRGVVKTYFTRLQLKVHITPEVRATYQRWI